jgi:hypothetical protein
MVEVAGDVVLCEVAVAVDGQEHRLLDRAPLEHLGAAGADPAAARRIQR